MITDLYPELGHIIGAEADRMGIDAYFVGGVVRDHFLGRPCTDIDIVCIGHDEGGEVHIGIELAKAVSKIVGGSKVSVFKTFGTASFKVTLPASGGNPVNLVNFLSVFNGLRAT